VCARLLGNRATETGKRLRSKAIQASLPDFPAGIFCRRKKFIHSTKKYLQIPEKQRIIFLSHAIVWCKKAKRPLAYQGRANRFPAFGRHPEASGAVLGAGSKTADLP
jgi:hypothetical protein